MQREIDAGVLRDVQIFGPDRGLYVLMDGQMPGVLYRMQCLTRGRGRENAATRIPIRLEGVGGTRVDEVLATAQAGPDADMFNVLRVLHRNRVGGDLFNLSLLLVKMPRPGNKRSGWEWNAPGGTAKFTGETREAIAGREFSEETGTLRVLGIGNPFPPYMLPASGAYDEVQNISFALVRGDPSVLVEGAAAWNSIRLSEAVPWMHRQNTPEVWTRDEDFVPVDLKVVLAVNWLVLFLKHELHFL